MMSRHSVRWSHPSSLDSWTYNWATCLTRNLKIPNADRHLSRFSLRQAPLCSSISHQYLPTWGPWLLTTCGSLSVVWRTLHSCLVDWGLGCRKLPLGQLVRRSQRRGHPPVWVSPLGSPSLGRTGDRYIVPRGCDLGQFEHKRIVILFRISCRKSIPRVQVVK